MEFDFDLRAYLVALEGPGKNANTAIKMEDMEEGVRKRDTILYAVLTSLVHGRPQKLLKAVTPGNGFECYRQLAAQATPQLLAQALALLQSILQVCFAKTATLTENLQRLDDLVKQAMENRSMMMCWLEYC